MGKDLKGKELGKGLGQRKDKYYYAKYLSRKERPAKLPYFS